MNKIFFLSLTVVAVLLEAAADIFFKKWSNSNLATYLIFGLIMYLFGTAFWAYSLKYETLSRAAVIFTILNLIIVVMAGVFIFHDVLTVRSKIGIILGLAAVILLEA